MKVKLFQAVVSVSGGSAATGDFSKIEHQINAFLAENQTARPVDIKFTSNAAQVGGHVTNYGCIALLLYDEV